MENLITQKDLTQLSAKMVDRENEIAEISKRYSGKPLKEWSPADQRVATVLLESNKVDAELADKMSAQLQGHLHTAITSRTELEEVRKDMRGSASRLTYDEAEKAYHAGIFWLAQKDNLDNYTRAEYDAKLKKFYGKGIDDMKREARALSESVDTYGGFLTPNILNDAIIAYRAQVGIAREHCQVVNMGTDQVSFPKRYTGITTAYQSENSLATNQQPQWSNVTLNAKTLMGFTSLSNQLNEDSIIDLGQYFTEEFGYNLAWSEDQALVNGDGTSTYGGIKGLSASMAAVSGTNKSIYNGIVGSKNNWSNITAGDFLSYIGTLTPFAGSNPAFYCSQFFYASVMLAMTVNGSFGGNTLGTWQAGIGNIVGTPMQRSFMGFPVYTTYVMPSNGALSTSASQNVCYFGTMSQSVQFGNRANPVFASTNVGGNAFQANQTLWRVIERYDIACHSVGNILLPDNVTTVASPLVAYQTK